MIPGLSVFWVVFFVLALAVILDRLLFKPLIRVIGEREARVRSARELAAAAAERARAAAAEFDRRTGAAQIEVYRQMDETRHAALQRRAQLLERTREEVEASLAGARARLAEQAEAAGAQLDRQADELADAVVVRVLGRKAS